MYTGEILPREFGVVRWRSKRGAAGTSRQVAVFATILTPFASGGIRPTRHGIAL